MTDMSTEQGLGTGVPTAAGLPAAPPPAPPAPARQSAPEGDRAVASNIEPTTDHEAYAVEARDEAVEKQAQAYEDAGETDAAEKIRAQYQDPADATA